MIRITVNGFQIIILKVLVHLDDSVARSRDDILSGLVLGPTDDDMICGKRSFKMTVSFCSISMIGVFESCYCNKLRMVLYTYRLRLGGKFQNFKLISTIEINLKSQTVFPSGFGHPWSKPEAIKLRRQACWT